MVDLSTYAIPAAYPRSFHSVKDQDTVLAPHEAECVFCLNDCFYWSLASHYGRDLQADVTVGRCCEQYEWISPD